MAEASRGPGADTSLRGALLDGRYRVIDQLGRGGMATVYSAVDQKFDRLVVAKVPRPDLLRQEGFRERFDQEIRSLIELDHPKIVKIHDVGELDGVPYAVLQHLAGGTLEERLESLNRPESPEEVLAWLDDVAEALDFIHGAGLIHRDVKPGNVLFDKHGHAFLADFGITKAVGDTGTRLTDTGATPGTPEYMAPEQGLDQQLTQAADQYSLATTVYRALAGRPPHQGDTPLAVLSSKNLQDPPNLDGLVPNLPAPASRAVMRGLARSPAARFDSCTAFAGAFRDGLVRVHAPDPGVRMRVRDLWLPVVGAFVLVAAALAIAMLVEHWSG